MAGRIRYFRRTVVAAVAVGAAVVGTWAGGIGAAAQEAPPAAPSSAGGGRGAAIATSYKVNPSAASLSLGITFGLALADFTNTHSRAESKAFDLGPIGATLTAEGCDGGDPTVPPESLPKSLRAESSDPKAADGYTEQDETLPFITKSVYAKPTPDSQADTTTLPLGDGSTVIINGAHSRAATRVLEDGTREALGIVDIAEVRIADAVVLGGLHWEAIHHSGTDATVKGTFAIGSLTVGGTPVPTNDPSAALEAANTALKPLGVQLRPPVAHEAGGIQFVDPLAIAVVPAPERDSVFGGIIGGAQPARQVVTDAMLEASCSASGPITIADVVVGSITGAGSFGIELGGVQATTAELKRTSFLTGIPQPSLNLNGGLGTAGTPAKPGTAATPGTPATAGTSASVATPATSGSSQTAAAAPTAKPSNGGGQEATTPVASTTGARGGALAGVAGAGLALLFGMAEGDRRMMRRAQRQIPLEA